VLLEETSFPSATLPGADTRSAKMRGVVRWLSSMTDGIVAVAPAIGRYLADEVRVPAAKIHVVANGVEEFAVASDAEIRAERARLGFPPGAFVLGGVGRIYERYKRFGDILLAVRELRRIRDVRALIVGEGVDLDRVRRRAVDLGVEDAVVFTGRREDRGLFFGTMDCFVLSSATEAAPLALMEAMIAGKPCVATTVGGVADIAADGVSALLVPPNDPTRLVAAIRRVVEDETLRTSLGRGARAHGLAQLTATRYVSDLRDLYVERLAARGVPLPSTVRRAVVGVGAMAESDDHATWARRRE
jgi:glycosyltransferase involved in cell wall biosynthesis